MTPPPDPIQKAATTLDPERQDQARDYARIQRQFMLLDMILGAGLLLAWLLAGWSVQLRDWIQGWTASPWIAVIAFGAVFGGVFSLLNLPLSYYTGYILPHRFKQSNLTHKIWLTDQAKGLLVSGLLGGLVLEVIYLILRNYPDNWWLWAAGFFLIFNVLIANLAPVLLFPLFYEFTPLGEDNQPLGDRLMGLAEKAGAPVMGVFRFSISRRTKGANAGLTGLGGTRRIILGDTLLDEFPPREIETVLAHELGHHVNRDIPLGMLIQTAITLGGLYLTSLILDWGVNLLGFDSPADLAALPLFGLSLGLYGLVTMPFSNGFSRWRESLADRYALQLTGDGKAYASALTRLSNQNLADVNPPTWVEFFLHSHPALRKRIQRAEVFSETGGTQQSRYL
jgi:STE24 endopeptidase